jgi:hypothetical protein
MASLLDTLRDQLSEGRIQQMAGTVGAEPGEVQSAVDAALPLLVGALAKNATASDDAAQSLDRALAEDHDGSLLDHVGDLFGAIPERAAKGGLGALTSMAGSMIGGDVDSRSLDGSGILSHLLGSRLRAIEEGIARMSGLDRQQVRGLLEILAPLAMAALGRIKRQENLGADGVARALEEERKSVEQNTPDMDEGTLFSLLDRDDDGSIIDDVSKLGSRFGTLFGR